MPTITGTTGNDTLTVLTDTSSVQAGAGTDTAVFSGDYADYTFSQSDSYVSILTHNTTEQVVSLFGVELLQFDDVLFSLTTSASGEFQVNTYTTSYQNYPSVTALNDGGFVVTWQSGGQNDGSTGIYAQMYNADGTTQGSEFLVNTYTSSSQVEPSITALNDGGFVITWNSGGQDGDDDGVYAQMYNADGTTQGSEFLVNTETTYKQERPVITTLNDGDFVITWWSNCSSHYSLGGSGSGTTGIYAQMYNADGTTQGSEFLVNIETINAGYDESNNSIYTYVDEQDITALNDGGFVVTWRGSSTYSDMNIYVQMYNAEGGIVKDEFLISTSTDYIRNDPSTTALNDGGFVITWNSQGQDGDGNGVYAQMYNADGTSQGSEFLVNTYTDNYQSGQKITSLNDGGFIITWSSQGQDGDDSGVYAQIYDADGITQGREFQVNTYTSSSQGVSDITALDDGGFVITWTSKNQDGDSSGIFTQRYDSEGNALGETTIESYDAIISTAATDSIITKLTGTSVNLWKDGADKCTSIAFDSGEISIANTITFDTVKLAAANAYDFDINITDAIDVLRHIVDLEALTAGSAGYHAADVDNNGTVNITDAIDILRHIVDLETIDTFDVLDSNGARVTELDADYSGDAPTWTLVANGDVNMSGSYDADYVATVDIA